MANRQGLRPADAAKKMGLSVPTLYRLARTNPAFPKVRKLSPRVSIFFEDEIEAYMLRGHKVEPQPAAAEVQ